jgi:menaquinol-cytochrome c reductase iron-sulfur subunit
MIVSGLAAVMAAALGVPAALYLLYPSRVRRDPEWAETGDIGEFTPNQPQELVFRRTRLDGWKVQSEKSSAWVVRTSDGHVAAFSPWCTHLGCAYHWDEQRHAFVCPCHGSIFASDGRVLTGPAPRPLDQYEVKVDGGKLWLGPVRKSEHPNG